MPVQGGSRINKNNRKNSGFGRETSPWSNLPTRIYGLTAKTKHNASSTVLCTILCVGQKFPYVLNYYVWIIKYTECLKRYEYLKTLKTRDNNLGQYSSKYSWARPSILLFIG